MFYLDSSALVKLVVSEEETPALSHFLDQPGIPVVTSALARVEIARAARRSHEDHSAEVARVLSSVDQISLSQTLLDEAGQVEPPTLRSLDAIHLVSAQRIAADLVAFIAYDAAGRWPLAAGCRNRCRTAHRDAGTDQSPMTHRGAAGN